MNRALVLVLAGLLGLQAAVAHAHKLAPSLLALQENDAGEFAVSWKTPRFASTPVPIQPELPAGCTDTSSREWQYEGTGVRIDWHIRCSEPLTGKLLRVSGLGENPSAALVRIEWADGVVVQGMLNAEAPQSRVPARPRRRRTPVR